MALPAHVQPGQVIRSKDFNDLIDYISGLQPGAPAAGVPVPDVFGVPLAQAKTLITQPSVNLTLGSVFDVFGVSINPNTPSNGPRLVLNQAPPANTRVAVGSVVHLTIAAGSGGSPGGPVPIGDILVGGGVGAPGNITANSTHIFTFPVTAAVNLQEKFDVKAVIVGQNQPNLWKARVVTGTAPNFTEITEITIPAATPPLGVTQPVQVEVTVPNGTNGSNATLTLEVTSQKNASITDTSSPVQFSVGGAAPQPETIAIAFQGVTNGTVQAGNQVSVAATPGKSRITYQATVPSAGSYDVTFDTTPAGFTATVVSGTTQNATNTQLTFRVDVAKTGSPTPGTLKIRVKDPANAATVFGTHDQKLA